MAAENSILESQLEELEKPLTTVKAQLKEEVENAAVASVTAGSEGINLVGASRVIILVVVWNPAVERQAIYHAYRIGQAVDERGRDIGMNHNMAAVVCVIGELVMFQGLREFSTDHTPNVYIIEDVWEYMEAMRKHDPDLDILYGDLGDISFPAENTTKEQMHGRKSNKDYDNVVLVEKQETSHEAAFTTITNIGTFCNRAAQSEQMTILTRSAWKGLTVLPLLKDWMFKFKSMLFLLLTRENNLLTLELGDKLVFKGGSIDRLRVDDVAAMKGENKAYVPAGLQDKDAGGCRNGQSRKRESRQLWEEGPHAPRV